MNDIVELALRGVLIGVGASALMDLWGLLLRRRFGIATLDYAMLGRWIGNFPRGRFVHQRITSAEPVAGERPLGWLAHYAIGVTFAFLLLAIWGQDWARSPTIWPALVIGLGTIVAPWFVMQPAMGAGIMASRTPDPRAARLRNIATHTVYGVGLYGVALALTLVG
ncbi:MAG: DUF2938 domain-containing protein [Candidatus Limnocylindrales bacterium]